MKIQIDRLTNKVTGINKSPTPLYLEVEVNDDFILEKTVEMVDEMNPLIQKLYDGKYPLYMDGEDELYYEDGKKPIAFEEQEVTNAYTDEDGVEHTVTSTIYVAKEWEELEPVMVDNIITKTITLKDRPEEFTLEEVLQAKYQSMLEESKMDYILADIFLDESDMDFSNPNHSANTGYGMLELLPSGEAKTVQIELDAPASKFSLLEFNASSDSDIYVNDAKFKNGIATLDVAVNAVSIKFKNPSEKAVSVNSYAIGY